MSPVLKQPTYHLHKSRNYAVVTLNGKNHCLGPCQSPESREKYARLIAERRRNNGVLPATVSTVAFGQTSSPSRIVPVSSSNPVVRWRD